MSANKSAKCKTCFAQMNNMNKHVALVPEEKKPFKCNVCCAKFVQKNFLNTNVESIHKGNKPFKCDICEGSFAQKVALKSHVVASGGVNGGEKPLKCNACDCEFNRHMTKVHEGKKLLIQDASNVHERENLETRDQKLLPNTTKGHKFHCPICFKNFTSKYGVKDHILHVHEEKKKKFECSICSKFLMAKATLTRHIAQVHEGKKPNKCNICDKSFPQKSALNSHVASVHEGKKPFKCNVCDATFVREGNLNQHVTKIHEVQMNESIKEQNDRFFCQERKLFDSLYTINSENMIGQGGNARVFGGKSRTKVNSPNVAIKCVPCDNFLSKKQLSRVKVDNMEYRLLNDVQGVDGVITLYHFFQFEKENLIVMKKPDCAKELYDHIQALYNYNHDKELFFFENYCQPLIKQTVETLYGCHKKLVYHGDLSLNNFLIDKEQKVHLIDFGSGEYYGKNEGFNSCDFKSGVEAFDEYNKPPEAYNATTVQAEKATVWALGIVFFKMLHFAEVAENFSNCIDYPFNDVKEIQYKELPINLKLSPKVQEILKKCLEKDPSKRITLSNLKLLVNSWMPVFKTEVIPSFAPALKLTQDFTPKSATISATVITRKRNNYDQIAIREVNAKKPKVQIQQEEQSHHQQSHHHLQPQQQNHLLSQQQNHLLPQHQNHLLPQHHNHLLPQQKNHLLPQQQNQQLSQLQVMQLQMMQLQMMQMQQQMMQQQAQQLAQQPWQQMLVVQQLMQNYVNAYPHQVQQAPQPGMESQNTYPNEMNNYNKHPKN